FTCTRSATAALELTSAATSAARRHPRKTDGRTQVVSARRSHKPIPRTSPGPFVPRCPGHSPCYQGETGDALSPGNGGLGCRAPRGTAIAAESPRSAGRTGHVVEPRNAISAIGTDAEPSGDRSARWYGTTSAEVPGRAARFRPFSAASLAARQACSALSDEKK